MPRGRRRVAGSDDDEDDFDMTQASTSRASRTQRSGKKTKSLAKTFSRQFYLFFICRIW